jgi:hypothetical protein
MEVHHDAAGVDQVLRFKAVTCRKGQARRFQEARAEAGLGGLFNDTGRSLASTSTTTPTRTTTTSSTTGTTTRTIPSTTTPSRTTTPGAGRRCSPGQIR